MLVIFQIQQHISRQDKGEIPMLENNPPKKTV
jgi:hypothetical protein